MTDEPTYYVYIANGNYYAGPGPMSLSKDDERHVHLVACWPGDIADGPPAVLQAMRAAYRRTEWAETRSR